MYYGAARVKRKGDRAGRYLCTVTVWSPST
jgi:hypothetical protein